MSDKRIKDAVDELASALSEGGKDYDVSVEGVDVTTIEDAGRRFAYQVTVIERTERQVAP